MKTILCRLALVSVLLFLLAAQGAARELNVLTAIWAPYNMVENDELTGIGTEIVKATLDHAKIKYRIKIYPWARTYRMAVDEPDTMVYMIIRLPEREHLFKWIGPVVPVRSVLHKLKNRTDIQLTTLEDARKYKIGTTRNAAGHQYLLKSGFKNNENIFLGNSNAESVRLLFEQFVDLESSVEMNFKYEASRLEFPSNAVEEALLLFESQGYIAFSQATSDDIVKKVEKSFNTLKAQGVVDAIILKYRTRYKTP